jgi:hypothetical protein
MKYNRVFLVEQGEGWLSDHATVAEARHEARKLYVTFAINHAIVIIDN